VAYRRGCAKLDNRGCGFDQKREFKNAFELAPGAAAISRASATIAKAAGLTAARQADRSCRGIDGEKAVLAFVIAGRLHAPRFRGRHVHQRRSRLFMAGRHKDPERSTFPRRSRRHAQFLSAQSLEVGGVKADQIALTLVEAQNLRSDGFKSNSSSPLC